MSEPAPLPPPPHDPEADEVGAIIASDLLDNLFDTLRPRDDEPPALHAARREAAANTALSLAPRDPLDMMFAVHAVASHHAAIECYRRAMLAKDNPAIVERMQKNAIALSRHMGDTAKTLAARQVRPATANFWAPRLIGGKTP